MDYTQRRGSFASSNDAVEEPDIMNDPNFTTNVKGKEKDGEDADTCRICRGEGSQGEPLFYPCKCSGSIRFVHQNCLMEWLAHSQKKHCELCKTPFRFTKLYHPQMPSMVPIPVFLRQATLHAWVTFQTWTRFQMVFFVWVFWLPWCMRTIWRGLFWVGDGGWVDWSDREVQNTLRNHANETTLLRNGTTPNDVHLLGSRKAAAAAFMNFFGTKATQMLNSNPWRKEPMSVSLAKRLYHLAVGGTSSQDLDFEHMENFTNFVNVVPRSSTWLSDLPFLSTMTRSTTLNNIIIDTLEGQLITLFVVVAFILIFLIREWVLQQQQNRLLGPDGDNEEAGGPNIDDPAQPRPGQEGLEQNPAEAGPVDNEPRPRLFVRPRRRLNRPLPHAVGQQAGDQLPGPAERHSGQEEPTTFGVQESSRKSMTGLQQLLPPKKDENGDIFHPPSELEDLLRESSIFREILQRVQDDPTLEIMTIIKTEIPAYEVDNLLQRLSSPRVGTYLKAVHFTPPTSPARGVHDEKVEALKGGMDRFGSDEGFGFPAAANSTSQGSATSHHSLVSNPDTVDDAEQNIPSSEGTNDVQKVHATAPQDDSKVVIHTSSVDSEFQPVLPSGSLRHQPQSWTFSDGTDDVSDIQYTPQESSDEASQSKELKRESNLINESQMLEKLDMDDTASGGFEGSHSAVNSPGSEDEHTHDEEHNDPFEEAAQDQGYLEAIKNWLWGDISLPPEPVEQPAGDEEHIVNNLAEEEPFVPVAHGQHLLHPPGQPRNQAQDPEVLAAAAQAGIDPNEAEGVDEIEDLEGIMELIGMEGPLAGLMQNGMFCAVLVSLTIFFGVWIPYMSGKVFLTLLASPVTLPLKVLHLASTGADMVVDTIVLLAGGTLYWTDVLVNLLCQPVVWLLPALKPYLDNKVIAQTSASYAEHALDRLVHVSFLAGEGFGKGIDLPTFSIIAHESLRDIELQLAKLSKIVFEACGSLIDSLLKCRSILEALRYLSLGSFFLTKAAVSYLIETLLNLACAAPSTLHLNPLKLNLVGLHRTTPLDFELAAWDATDRAIAVVAGYTFFAFLGVVYLYIAGALHGTNKKGAVNGSLAQVLYQAGGVIKVILIISIEMIVFPLYCGLLLDVALLPLFGNVTLMSRVAFTTTSPWTSVFVHWFVGTCYMFHFALFVSMCRKIMRTGVLYFIRDPDDPTFHPVRDVLERSVSSQLWKISFSALVYGGLVLVCLGGVVWGIAYAFEGVFPIHWSSDEPVLEFPVDLLFYNFLMPTAVKFFKPSIGLNKIYGWWFRKCARLLRLSSFLFNNTRSDEEGRHVRRTWTDVLQGAQGDVRHPVIGKDRQTLAEDRGARAIFLRDGKYVRTPGSDQVRIPKGATTFVEVDEEDHRLDDVKDGDEDPFGRKMNLFMKVYIPPFFGTRIAAFVCLIWLFAAFTGVSVTVVPLLFGRLIFAKLTPNHLRINDIYAFSMGIYILGGAVWALLNHRRITRYIYETMPPLTTSLTSALHRGKSFVIRVLALLYAYSAIGILLPCLFSLNLEVYLIIPLHTYLIHNANFADTADTLGNTSTTNSYPVIHIIQDWTLGVLYIKIFARLVLWTEPSRPALALRAIVARGWLNPDINLATRAFIFPATLVLVLTLTTPLALGWVANQTILHAYTKNDPLLRASVYRYTYPAMLALGLAVALLWLLGKLFQGWRRRIRDEVYLIGERLHNFGEGARTGAMSRVRVGKIAVGRAAQ